MATERSYYEVLGVERNASDADLKRAFRKLAQQWHPDVNTEAAASERFKEINEAYQVLSDPRRRQIYDMVGTAGLGDMGGAGSPFGEGFAGFGDLFDAFELANAADLALYNHPRYRGPELGGHDLWLTRNGHGAGFWDRDDCLPEEARDRLTAAAKKYGEVYLSANDGAIYQN